MGFIPSDDGDDDAIAKSVLDGSYFNAPAEFAPTDSHVPRITIGRPAVESDTSFRNFFKKHGFGVNRTYGRAINQGSPHTYGGAADINIHGKSGDELYNLMRESLLKGYRVFDERKPAPGVKQTGPHIHVENAKTTLKKPSRFVNQGLRPEQIADLQELDSIRLGKGGKPRPQSAPETFDADAYARSLFDAQGSAQPRTPTDPIDELTTIGKAAKQGIRYDQMPVTERPETLNAQRFAANSPKSTRAGVLYTDASTAPPITEQELDIPIQGNQVLRVNKLKFQQYQNQTGISPELISIGQADFTPLIGGKAQPTGEVAGTTGKIAVMSIGKDGKELVSSSVTDPSAVIDEAILHKKQFPDEPMETKVVTADEVIAARQPDATTTDPGQLEGTDTSIVEVPDEQGTGFTTSGFDVDPANTPEIADKGEAVYRQAVGQLGRQLYGRDLNKLELEALVGEQRQAKGGFAYKRGTSEATNVDGRDRYVFEPEDVKRISNILDQNQGQFAEIRKGNLKDFLAAGGELDAEAFDRFKELGMTPEELNALTGLQADNTVAPTEFMDSVKADRDKYQTILKSYRKSEDEYQKLNAQTLARQEMGWITPQQALDEIAQFEQLKAEKDAELKGMAIYGGGGQGVGSFEGENIPSLTPEVRDQQLQNYLKQTIGRYGTAANYKAVLKKQENDEIARKKRVSEMPWSDYLLQTAKDFPMNVTKSAVSTAVSGSLRGIALGAKKIDDALFGEDNPRKEVSGYGSYQLAKYLDDALDRTLPVDKDMQGEFLAGKLPQGLGSTLGMALGGASRTPRLAVAVLSSLQMGGDAYKEAKDGGAAEEEAQLYGMLSAPLGVTEIFGIGEAINRLNKGTGGTVWKKLWKEAYRAGKGELGEELLQEGGQTTSQNIIASLTFDPDRKADKDLYENLLVAGISAPLASAGVTVLNVARNRQELKKVIQQEQANGVIIKSFGDGELYVFGEKVDVTPDLKPMVDRYDNSRKGILEKQQQIATIQKGAEGKSIAEMEPYLEALWTAKKDLNSLEKRQVQISKDIAEKAGVPVPEGTVEETIAPTADEDLLAPINNEETAPISQPNASLDENALVSDQPPQVPDAVSVKDSASDTPATEPESISQTNEKTPTKSKDSNSIEIEGIKTPTKTKPAKPSTERPPITLQGIKLTPRQTAEMADLGVEMPNIHTPEGRMEAEALINQYRDPKTRYWKPNVPAAVRELEYVLHSPGFSPSDLRKTDATEYPAVQKAAERITDRLIKSDNEYIAKNPNSSVTARDRDKSISGYVDYFNKFAKQIDDKDYGEIVAKLHVGNPDSIKFFKDYTGVDIGKTNKSIETALNQWGGEGIAKYRESLSAARETERAARQTADQKRERDTILGEKVRYKNKVLTRKEWIDALIDEGFNELGAIKKGAINRRVISHPNLDYHELKKSEAEYAEEVLGARTDELVAADNAKEAKDFDALPEADKKEIDRLFAGTVNPDAITPENIDQISAITDKIGNGPKININYVGVDGLTDSERKARAEKPASTEKPKPAQSTADLFREKLAKLKAEQDATKDDDDGWADLDEALGLKAVLPEEEQPFFASKYKTYKPIFDKIVAGFDTKDPGEQMETFLRKMNERYSLEVIAGLEPYVVKFFDDSTVAPKAETKQEAKPDKWLADAFAKEFAAGTSFASIVEARKLASDILGKPVKPGTELAKQVDEAIEVGVVMRARQLAAKESTDAETYDRMVKLYDQQPNLNVRTSTSMREQAYSTPAPLAFVASRLAGIDENTTVYEPTAGNGMLLMEAPDSQKTTANELNEARYNSLREVLPNAFVSNQNAVDTFDGDTVDRVIGNPPFGVVKDEDGDSVRYQVNDQYDTTEIDHAIVFESLKWMKPDGKAVFIIGGVNAQTDEAKSDKYNAAAKRKFYYSLFQEYNVVDLFTVAGSLYSKQGASYPVDVIVIDGKGKSSLKLPAASLPRVYDSWDGLKELVSDEPRTDRTEVKTGESGSVDARSGESTDSRSGGNPTRASNNTDAVSDVSRGPRSTDVTRGSKSDKSTRESDGSAKTEQSTQSTDFGDSADIGGRDVSVEPVAAGKAVDTRSDERSAEENTADEQTSREDNDGLGLGELDDGNPRVRKERKALDSKSASDTGQVPYEPQSNGQAMNTLVPTNLHTAVINSLEALESKVGPVDDYVAAKLGYKNAADVHRYFAGEQLDALALALYNMENGAGFIIGDQTGIGKGRVVAGVLKYAMESGQIPIFVTEKPNLYKDMIRDLNDIGVVDVRPLMTDAGKRVPLDDDQTQFLTTPASTKHNVSLMNMTNKGELDEDYNLVFTTYNQMQAVKQNETARREFLREMANRGIIVFDESHNAGGSGEENKIKKKVTTASGNEFDRDASDRSEFARELVGKANGVFYSSATYAKRPEVMSLYSKTDMRHAVTKESSLAEAINKGGVPLQQVVATMLAESGQYIRRERDFTGINYDTIPIKVDKVLAEKVSSVMLAVKEFDDVKQKAVAEIKNDLKEEAGAVMSDSAIGNTGVSSTNFTSIMHNLIDQMLLTLKLDGAIDNTLKALKNGEKVVLTLSNTMGSFIEEFARENNLTSGDAIGVHFGDMLVKYLERSREVQIGMPFKTKITKVLTDEELGPQAVSAYKKALELIQGKKVNYKDENGNLRSRFEGAPNWETMPASPIDYLKFRLEQEGYKVGEVTGRQHTINYNAAGEPIYRMRPAADILTAGRIKTVTAFNGGSADNPLAKEKGLDVVILNQAGSTGLSLHASEKFAEQQKRKMFIIQAEKNIDTHMQMLGRINRTGQVNKPAYGQLVADIPAEIRPAAVLAKKMASLNANTTASRDSAVTAKDTLDFINEYGDEVIATLMEENPEIHKQLGEPLKGGDTGLEKDGAARKVTGRIPLLPLAEQEKLYEQIAEEYTAYIERLNQLGENKLEAETLPLDAITHSKTQVFEGTGNAPFKRGAQAEDVEVKKLTKPYSTEQVMTTLRDNLDISKQAENKGMADIAQAGQRAANEHWAEIREEADKYIEEQLDALSDADKIRGQRVRLEGLKTRLATAMRAAPIGAMVKVKTEYGDTYGVVANFRRKTTTKNPLALSNYEFTVYTTDAMRQLKIPASKMFSPMNAPTGEDTGKIFIVSPAREVQTGDGRSMPIMEAFDHGQTTRTERRTIITGNLLAGFAQFKQGRIINFTTKDGDIRQGILMPAKFDTAKALEDKPIEFANSDQIVRFLAPGNRIVTDESETMRVTHRYGDYTFTVPASKAKGGAFFLNRGITNAAGQDFVKSGSSMVLRLEEEDAIRVLNEMQGQGVAFTTTSFKDAAREITGAKKAEAVAVNDEPRGQKSVLDPHEQKRLTAKTADVVSAEEFDDAALGLATLDLEDDQVRYPKLDDKKETSIGGGTNYDLYILDRDRIPDAGPFEISIQDGGDAIGFIRATVADKILSINLIHLAADRQGEGIGTEIYRQFLDDGYTIKSDSEITDATYSLYQRLAKDYQPLIFGDGRVGLTSGTNSILKSALTDKNTPDEKMTVEEMRNLPYEPIDTILDGAEMTRTGDLLKMNAKSHELLRRSFEEARINEARRKGKNLKPSEYEDLFTGTFLKPEVVDETEQILLEKAVDAKNLGYSPEEVAVFTDHARMLREAADEGNGTAVIFVLDKSLPHERFHQADYLGAAEKTVLNRHSDEAKAKLDKHWVRGILWKKHYSKYGEYTRIKSQKVLDATLRAEIPAFLLESSEKDLAAMGITPEMAADYMLTWFEGYAAKNGIDSLDHFDKEELDVKTFITQIKDAYAKAVPVQNGGTRKGNETNNQQEPEPGGENTENPRSDGSSTLQPIGTDTDGVRLTAETHLGRRIEKRQAERDAGLGNDRRLRSLPLTMRRAGIEVIDEAYDVFHDAHAIEMATDLLEQHGIEGSIELLRNIPAKGLDAEHGILSFMLIKTLQNHAASIRDTDPANARKYFELSLELAREHAIAATQLGRFTRVPSIIGPSVETLKYAIQGIIEARANNKDKTISAEAWERIEAQGRDLESALTTIEGLRRENRNKQAQIKRLKDEKEGKKRKRTKAGVANRQRLVDLVLGDKKRATGIEDARARLLAKFTGRVEALKSVLPENIDNLKNWFKESKVVDKKGEPLRVYRGDVEHKDGIFFTSSTDTAEGYTRRTFFRGGNAPQTTAAYLSLQNPLIIDALGKRNDNIPVSWSEWKPKVFGNLPDTAVSVEDAYAYALKNGYDGLIVKNVVDTADPTERAKPSDVYAVKSQNQIKSAIGNNGEYSDDSNILKSVLPTDENAPLDADTLNDFSEVGAMMLTEGLADEEEYLPSDFRAEMLAEFGDGIAPYFDEIYKAAWNQRQQWLDEERFKATKERITNRVARETGDEDLDLDDDEIAEILGKDKLTAKRRRFIERYHEITAGGKKPRKNLDAYKSIITELTKDKSDNIALGAMVMAEGLGTADIHKRLVAFGITEAADQREALREGAKVWEEAKRIFRDQQESIANEILEAEGDLRKIDELQWLARKELKDAQATVADEMRRIKNGEGWYALSQLTNVLNVSRTMMASFDMSGALRQGGFFTFAKPEMQKQAFVNMFKSIDEKGFGNAIMDIERSSNFTLSQRSGIDYAVAGKVNEGSLAGEELFKGEKTIEAIPVIGKLVAEGVVKWSERTYTAFLDTQRYVMFDVFAKELMSRGLTFRNNPEEFQKIADFINIATGRGVMPSNKFAKLLMDLPLFAPRYTLSRLQLINMTLNPVAYANMPPASRKIIAKQAVRFYGTTMGILGLVTAFGAAIGASVNWDDDDDDFLKIKIGNQHYDIFAGTLQPAKMLIKIIHSAIRNKGGFDNRLPGEFGNDILGALGRFARGKLSPTWSFATDFALGSDYVGDEFKWSKALVSRIMPLAFADAYEAYKLDGAVGVARSTPFSFFGVGMSNYKPRPERPETEAEKLAAKTVAYRMTSQPQTDEDKRKRKIIQDLTARSRNGEDISEELKAAKKAGDVTDQQENNIYGAARKTLLVDKAEGLTLDELERVYRVATPAERDELMRLMNKKMKNADVDGKLKPEQRERLETMGATIPGDVAMPDKVKEQFDALDISTPDVGEQLVLKKGDKKTRLTDAQYDKYRRETLERIYKKVGNLIEYPQYQKADEETRKKMIQGVIRKQRAEEQKETKRDVKNENQ